MKYAPFTFAPSNPESDSYMGVIKLPETATSGKRYHRRIDIKVYPAQQYAFALLYFTGSDHFNRSMRYYAKKVGWVGNIRQGWSLSDRGIVWATYDKVPPSKKYEKVSEGELCVACLGQGWSMYICVCVCVCVCVRVYL